MEFEDRTAILDALIAITSALQTVRPDPSDPRALEYSKSLQELNNAMAKMVDRLVAANQGGPKSGA